MSRRLGSLLAVWLLGCPTPTPPSDASGDASTDVRVPLDAPVADTSAEDAGTDAAVIGRDVGLDGGRTDVGPDMGSGSCASPLDFDALSTLEADGARVLSVDLTGRADHRALACSPGATGPDAVLRLTAPASGRLFLETLSDADTILSVHAACDDTIELACADDAVALSSAAALSLDVMTGQELFVVLDTYTMAAAARPIELRARVLPTRALGTPCDPREALDVCVAGAMCATPATGATCVATSATGCASPIDLSALYDPVTRTAVHHGTTVGGPDALRSSCQTGVAPEIVHRFRMPFRGRLRVDVRGGLVSVVSVRTTCGVASSEVACERRGVITADALSILEAGTELFLVVEAWAADVGPYELELSVDRIASEGEPCMLVGRAIDLCDPMLTCRAESTARTCRAVVCGDGLVESSASATEGCDTGPDVPGDGCSASCAFDDACATPIDLLAFGTVAGDVVDYEGTTAAAGDEFRGSCSRQVGGLDRVFVYTPPRTGMLTLSTVDAATTFDTVLYVRADCAGTTDLACNDDVTGSTRSRIELPVTASVPVFIVVDGYSATTLGRFHLTATLL